MCHAGQPYGCDRLLLVLVWPCALTRVYACVCVCQGVEETGPFNYRVRIYFPILPGSVANLLTDMGGRMPQDAIRM